jgi:MarC family integral membrane protein
MPFDLRTNFDVSLHHTPDGLPLTAITAAVIGAGVTFAALLLAIQLGSRLGRSTQAIVTRFMGLIVASMGMQFVLAGLTETTFGRPWSPYIGRTTARYPAGQRSRETVSLKILRSREWSSIRFNGSI